MLQVYLGLIEVAVVSCEMERHHPMKLEGIFPGVPIPRSHSMYLIGLYTTLLQCSIAYC